MMDAVDTLFERHFEFCAKVQEDHPSHELVTAEYAEASRNWWALMFCASEHKFLYVVDDKVFTSIRDVPDDLFSEFNDAVAAHLESLNMRTFSDLKTGQFFYPLDEDKPKLMEKVGNSSAKYHYPEDGEYRVFHNISRVRLHLG